MLESFKDQMYLLSSVTRLSFEILKESVLFKYLVLKVFPVSPTGFLFHVVFSRNCGLVDYPLCLALRKMPNRGDSIIIRPCHEF